MRVDFCRSAVGLLTTTTPGINDDVKKMQEAVSQTGNPLSTSIQYVFRHPSVKQAILGIRTLEQLNAIIAASEIKLNDPDLGHISKNLNPNIYVKHR